MTLSDTTLLPPVVAGPVAGRESRFSWRGLLLDSARTRYDVAEIKRVIELGARYGVNRLHWHLTDDQGWRIEIPEFPLLAQIGGSLERTRFDDYDSLSGDTRELAVRETPARWCNGFYTDAEIAEVIAHADAHGILVVPEIDLPGHMMAAITAYPSLGRPEGLPLPEGSMREHMWWPARNDLLWPTDEARDFLATVLRRVASLFPGPYVHIGGDECAYLEWESDPQMAGYLAERGVNKLEDLQGWFMAEAATVLAERGKKIVAWDEAAGIVGEDALLMAWDEERGMERVAETAHEFVFTDARTLYLCRVDPDAVDADGNGQKGMVPAISVTDILSAPWPLTRDERCVGIQACAWSEFMLDGEDMLSLLFPRLIAVAERWYGDEIDVPASAQAVAREYAVLVSSGLLSLRARDAVVGA